MRKLIFEVRVTVFLSLFLLIFQWATAQTGIVSGTVKDVNGDPLPFALISVEGKKVRTITDAGGNYSLKLLPGKYRFVIKYVSLAPLHLQVIVKPKMRTRRNFIMTGVTELENVTVMALRSRDTIHKFAIPVSVDVIRKNIPEHLPNRNRPLYPK